MSEGDSTLSAQPRIPTRHNFKNRTGHVYDRLTVVEFAGRNRWGHVIWRCRCECGGEVVTEGGALATGNTRSCGCLIGEKGAERLRNRFTDLTGKRFGRLSVLGMVGLNCYGKRYWECECECGKTITAQAGLLKNGHVRSCGCLARESRRHRLITHGECTRRTSTPEYRAYLCAKYRCTRPGDPAYQQYGGRGIQFLFTSFEQFLTALGRRPSAKHSLDRIDVNGPYSVDNCRWATMDVQLNNTTRNRYVMCGGQRMTVAQASRATGLKVGTLHGRLRAGWCHECATTIPMRVGGGGQRNRACPHG